MAVFSHDHEESVFNPVQLLILALFLQLLVFFILMNSISVFSESKDRMKLIKDSVAGFDPTRINGSSIFSNMGAGQGTGTVEGIEDQTARFAYEIPGFTDKPIRRAGLLEMTFSGSAMNTLLGMVPGVPVNERLQAMIEFLKKPENKGTMVVLIKTIRPEVYTGELRDPAALYYPVQEWAQAFERAGLPPAMLRVGVGPGHAGGVILRLETPVQKKVSEKIEGPGQDPVPVPDEAL